MTLDEDQCWVRLAGARHGVLATVHPSRGVDAVPVVYAVSAVASMSSIVIPIDSVKPKRSSRLQRLVNLEGDARCVLLVDHYDDEWSRLWWVQVHARATAAQPSDLLIRQLADRYPPYRQPGSVESIIVLRPTDVSGWCASTPGDVSSTK